VPLGERESAIARLLDLAPGGFQEIDRGNEVELAAYVDVDGEAAIRGAFADVVATVVEPGWEDRWREFHRPVWAGGVWLGPPWETPPAGAPAVVIDPGRAFGTGAHPTTQLCVELLARLEERGSLLDVGCGSGVLAIAAARLGYGPIVAIDDDQVAVEVTRANAEVNRVELEARLVDAESEALPATDVAVANILLRPVEAILARLESEVVVTSGYLSGERPRAPGWEARDHLELDGWSADLFARERARSG
jgi:ribosomal protein L11 methyltransferase